MKAVNTDPLLEEQTAYYRAAANEYRVPPGAARELAAALEAFRPSGDVLELACPRCASAALETPVPSPSLSR